MRNVERGMFHVFATRAGFDSGLVVGPQRRLGIGALGPVVMTFDERAAPK